MTMTLHLFAKRHYEAIAAVLRNARPLSVAGNRELCQWDETCRDFADMLEKDSPKFDIIRFMKACREN
jgi:hypothetical protein